ncbi:SRPBCC family protein [Arthrobacter psychrochitiniphilus]|uniref:SRPBCC family protein n=1 Tax=Arthrobacter psychrochitiniphilus TaxID=291045 RepID=UPI003F7C177B
MELNHRFAVPSSLEATWRSFNQLEEIAPCFPGATLTGVDGDTFTGTVKIKLGPIAMLYAGTGEYLSRDEATHTVIIAATGKDKRGNGTAGATVTAVLRADGDGTTVDVSTTMNVTGKPAQFGRGVIQDISDKLLEQFVQCVISKAEGPPEDAVEPVPVVEAEALAEPAESKTLAPPPTRASAPELDLGQTVLPVLAKRFGPAVLAAVALLGIVLLICGRRKTEN